MTSQPLTRNSLLLAWFTCVGAWLCPLMGAGIQLRQSYCWAQQCLDTGDVLLSLFYFFGHLNDLVSHGSWTGQGSVAGAMLEVLCLGLAATSLITVWRSRSTRVASPIVALSIVLLGLAFTLLMINAGLYLVLKDSQWH